MNKNALAEFDEFYKLKLKPNLFNDYQNAPQCIKNIIKRFDHMIDYNVPHGKKLRGLCVYESLSLLIDKNANESQTKELLDQAKAIGWCIEFVSYLNFD